MQCQDVQKMLPDLCRGELPAAAEDMLLAHLPECQLCSSIYGREQRLLDSLRQLPVANMPADFPARALRRARDLDQSSRFERAGQRMRYGLSAAASVLLVSGIGFMLGQGLPGKKVSDQPAPVALAVGETQLVSLRIEAPAAFDSVKFEVRLPENVELRDQPGLREFAWNGTLQQGVNVLSLPLTGVDAKGGQLIATVRFGGNTKSLKIPLKVNSLS